LKVAQIEVLQKCVDRVCVEINEAGQRKEIEDTPCNENVKAPLFWLAHGKPGVGKTYVINCLRELFEQKMGWLSGVEFEVVASQAVIADLLKGDTIHHSLGIDPFGANPTKAKIAEAAKRLEHLKWLIVDEVSMLSAALLAQIDERLRSTTSNIWKTK